MAELPGRLRCRICPKPNPLLPCLTLGLGILLSIRGGLFILILLVVPGHPSTKLIKIGILPVYHDLADQAPIAIDFIAFNEDCLVEEQMAQVFLRSTTKGLSLFRRIDSGKSDFVLLMMDIEDGNRIAIANTDDATIQGFSGSRKGQKAE